MYKFFEIEIWGIYLPILSCIRFEVLSERYRTILMTLFREPFNVLVIILLLFIKYFNPFYICPIVYFKMLLD